MVKHLFFFRPVYPPKQTLRVTRWSHSPSLQFHWFEVTSKQRNVIQTTYPYKTRTDDLIVSTYQSINEKTLSATDVLAPTTMKNAAKCDTSCELRNPVSHQNFERILHFLRGVCLLECLFIPTNLITRFELQTTVSNDASVDDLTSINRSCLVLIIGTRDDIITCPR